MYNNKIGQDTHFYLDKINLLEEKNEKLSKDIFMIKKANKFKKSN